MIWRPQLEMTPKLYSRSFKQSRSRSSLYDVIYKKQAALEEKPQVDSAGWGHLPPQVGLKEIHRDETAVFPDVATAAHPLGPVQLLSVRLTRRLEGRKLYSAAAHRVSAVTLSHSVSLEAMRMQLAAKQ